MNYRSLFNLTLFSLLFAGCGGQRHHNDISRDQPTAPRSAPKAFLIQGLEAKVFQDVSSELRCEALREFFVQFADQALDGGKMANFSCNDMSGDYRDEYGLTFELTSADKSAAIRIFLYGDKASETYYCKVPYSKDEANACSQGVFYYLSGNQSEQPGYIHPNMEVLRDVLTQYVAQPATKDLAFGIAVKDFAEAWVAKINSGEKIGNGGNPKLELVLTATPGDSPMKGTIKILDLNPAALEQRNILGCTTKECLTKESLPYSFNGHRLAIQNHEWHLIIPLEKPQ